MAKTKLDEVDMNRLSDLSYLDMPPDLALVVSDGGKVSIKELADYYLANPDKYKTGNIDRDNYLAETLEMCSKGTYKDINIVDYENQNVLVDGGKDGKIENSNSKDSGLVAYAFETSPESVTVVYRGSEDTKKSGSFKDWIDNFLISLGGETEQQAEAVKFLERVGKNEKYEIIDLAGHSKGGNNAIYAAIKCLDEVRKRINKCNTYNAPGQPNNFIEANKHIIDSMDGKIFNYQYEKDIVSSIFNSIGQVIVIENDIEKYIPSSFDYHQLYTAKIENGSFKIDDKGEKDVSCDIVHNVTNDLRMVLNDKEFEDLIKLIDKITDPNITKEEFDKIIDKLIDEIDIILPAIFTLLRYLIIEVISTSLQSSDNNTKQISEDVLNKVSEIDAIEELAKIRVDNKEYGFWEKLFWNRLKNLISEIRSMIDKFKSIKIKFEKIKESVEDNIIYSFKHSKFHINEASIESYINLYNTEIENMNSILINVNKSIGALLREGWEGKSKIGFIDIQYKFYENQIKDCIEEMQEVINFLEQCKSAIPDLYVEEKYLADVLGGY